VLTHHILHFSAKLKFLLFDFLKICY